MHKTFLKNCRTAVAVVLAVVLTTSMIPTSDVKAASGTTKSASEVVKDMTAGWNVGNTLDAQNGEVSFPLQSMNETGWGNPQITKTLIEAVGKAGFNTIRVPVSWGQYMDPNTGKIQAFALKRVKEVVDLCIDNGMYVILNTHHDIAEEYKKNAHYYPSAKSEEKSKKFFENVWTQVGNTFKNYDYHLVFETMNEPRLAGHSEEWWFPRNNPSQDILTATKYINEYNQVALDAIRATGGNNATRCVMVPGYDASTDGCMINQFQLPKDSASNRLIVSVHAYTPYYFALASEQYVTEFDRSSKTDIDNMYSDLNSKYMSKGIPVVIGEMGASNRNNTAERAKWADYYFTVGAKYPNSACVIWDNGISNNNGDLSNGEVHGYFNRNSGEVLFPEIFNAIMKHVDGTPAKSAGQSGNVQPTTVAPTTVAPTTQAPTTAVPTTEAPTKTPTTEVPSNPSATATMLNTYGASYGYIGTCINLSQLKDANTLALLKKNYNSVTLENEMKPDSILRNWSKTLITVEKAKSLGYYIPANYKDTMVPELNFATIDEVMKICCENNIGLRAHTLVWHSQTPKWFFKNNFDADSSYVSEATMDARMEMYVKTVMNHVYSNKYGKCVYAWDVVNEYPHANDENWLAVYGKCGNTPAFVKKAFKYAHEVLESYNLVGKVSLFFNDYNTYMEVNDVLAIMKYINSDGKICEGVGMQSHNATWFPSVQYYTAAVKAFTEAGYEVQITEMDVKNNNSETELGEYVYELFKSVNTLKKNGAKITGITWWGLSDQVTWIDGQKPLLFSTPSTPKPSYDKFLKAYKEVLGDPKEVKNPSFPEIGTPSTQVPTTVAPTTVAPTTVAPTTVAPTTVAPTTVAPTTVVPTTVAPTTVVPTTEAPTVKPSTEAPTVVSSGEVAGSKIPTKDHDQIMVFFKSPDGKQIDEHRCAVGDKVAPQEWIVNNIEHEKNGWGNPVVETIVGWRSTLTGKVYTVDKIPAVTEPVSYYAVFNSNGSVETPTEVPSTEVPTVEPSTETPVIPSKESVKLTNVQFGKDVNISAYNPTKITKIVVKFKGTATEFNGAVVLGEWAQQTSYNHNDCKDKTLTVVVKSSQNTLNIKKWWSNSTLEIESVELVY